jgi:hypothetical protein
MRPCVEPALFAVYVLYPISFYIYCFGSKGNFVTQGDEYGGRLGFIAHEVVVAY